MIDIIKPKGMLTVGFLIALVWFGIPTAKSAWQAWCVQKSHTTIRDTISRIHNQCVFRFNRKHDFVDLNGLFCRMVGVRVSNGVAKLDNGHLIPLTVNKGKPLPIAANIVIFSSFLKERKIPFLHVQAPYKMDLEMKMLPSALHHHAYEDIDELLSALSAAKVNVFDLRSLFAERVKDVEKYFYRTDHHWNGDAIFEAYRLTVQKMASMLGVPGEIISDKVNPLSWRRQVRDNWFLGSWGQRTGRFFGGLDEIIWHEPRFQTRQSCAWIKEAMWRKSDFASAVILREYVETRPDLFTKSAYGLYGGTRALVCYRNSQAPVKKKILMLGDSFSHPVFALCSTVFSELDTIDPRLMQKNAIAEYVVQTKPDMVVQLVNSDVFSSPKLFQYGTPNAIQWEKSTFLRTVLTQYAPATNGIDTVIVPEIKRGFNYVVDANGFKEVEGASLPEMVELALYNIRTGNVWSRMMFDTEFCNDQKKVHWEFSVPEVGYWDLRIRGCTPHSVSFENLTVKEFRPEKKPVRK